MRCHWSRRELPVVEARSDSGVDLIAAIVSPPENGQIMSDGSGDCESSCDRDSQNHGMESSGQTFMHDHHANEPPFAPTNVFTIVAIGAYSPSFMTGGAIRVPPFVKFIVIFQATLFMKLHSFKAPNRLKSS
jgi:hypothetical protein